MSGEDCASEIPASVHVTTRDAAIQCCLDQRKYMVTSTTSTQTDPLPDDLPTGQPIETTEPATTHNIFHDHSYCVPMPYPLPSVSPQKSVKSSSTFLSDDETNYLFSDDDEDFVIRSDEPACSTDTEPESEVDSLEH